VSLFDGVPSERASVPERGKGGAPEAPPPGIPSDTLEFLLRLLREGYHPVPCCRQLDGGEGCSYPPHNRDGPCPHPGKRPVVRWKTWKPTEENLKNFAGLPVNWALRTGREYNLAVIDVDFYKPEAVESFAEVRDLLPETVTVLTQHGGEQYWFKPDGAVPSAELLPGVEVKGEGGLAAIPPSKGYTFEVGFGFGEVGAAEFPKEVLELGSRRAKKPEAAKRSGPKLTEGQKEILESLLFRHLPGARRQGEEIVGYIEPSRSRAHIKANLNKGPGVFMDWHRQEGGTIFKLFRILGVSIPEELKEMGKPGIPEFFPIWALSRHWKQLGLKCGDVVSVVRADGVPIYSGVAYCLLWDCPSCAVRLENIYKAMIKREKIKAIAAAPLDEKTAKKLSRIKRKCREFERIRLIGGKTEWVLVKESDVENNILTLLREEFSDVIENPPEEMIDRIVEDLKNAKMGWLSKEKRVIPSRNFYSRRKKEESIYINFDDDSNKLTEMKEGAEKPKIDAVILKGDYGKLVEKFKEEGLEPLDASGERGETHHLNGHRPVSEEEFEDWGFEVVGLVKFSGKRRSRDSPEFGFLIG
jgi:hypothetical protein